MPEVDSLKDRLSTEFTVLESLPKISPGAFDAVVVFAAEETAVVGENASRIRAGLKLVRKHGLRTMVYLGTQHHNAALKRWMAKHRPELEIIYPTNRTQDSSRTQVVFLSSYLRKHPLGRILFVSSAYHIPRISRYCAKYLPGLTYSFFPVGDIKDQQPQVAREIDKIILYAAKGDLPLWV